MIKFFRKIRQGLISENKITKYLIYAVGEIILVVIGILIAVSINNKNLEFSKRRAEKAFYQNIKQHLLDDANNINGQIDYNSRHTNQFRYAIGLIESNNRAQKDSLGEIAINLANYSDFDRQGNIYETMVNSGDIKLLRNKEIVESLRRLEETYIYVNRMENIHLNVVMSIVPKLMEAVRLNSTKVENEDFIYSYQFQNTFVISLRIMEEKEQVYNWALSQIEQIIEQVDSELDPQD